MSSSEVPSEGVRFPLGTYLDTPGAKPVDFWPSNTRLTQLNIGVVGDLGTGKTQFLKSLIFQLRAGAKLHQPSPLSMLVFDYKRDYHDDEFLSSVGGVLLRPFHIPLAVLGIDGAYSPLEAVKAAKSFVDVIAKIYNIGGVQKQTLTEVIKLRFKENNGGVLRLSDVLSDYQEAINGGADLVTSALRDFVDYEVFSEDVEELRSMADILNDKVLVVALSDFGADDAIKTAIVTLFLNKYYEYMLRLTKWPFVGVTPNQLRRLNSFVLVDEATNIMQHEFPVLEQLLLQGREFGVGVILASQYVSHFRVKQTRYGESLLTKVIHKVPPMTVNDLRAFGIPSATQDMIDRIASLAPHQALCQTLGSAGRFIRGTPFFELRAEQ